MLTGVGVERNDRHLFHQHGLGLGEERIALLAGLGFGRAIQNQIVINRIAVVRVVVAPAGDVHVEKIIGIDVITDPAAPRHLKIDLGHGIEIHLPFLIGDGDIDVEL